MRPSLQRVKCVGSFSFECNQTTDQDIQGASPEMITLLKDLRKVVVTGFVGGSNLVKIQEQLGVSGNKGMFPITMMFVVHIS